MKQKAIQFLKHPLITGSFILVFGSLIANFFNFLFSIIMVRLLSPADFGTLSSVNAVITLPSLVASSISPLIVIFAATYFAEKKLDLAKGLYFKLTKIFLLISIIIGIIFLIFIPQINQFFHINNNFLLVLTDLIIVFSILSAVNTSYLQAKLAFKFYVILIISNALIKLISGYILVLIGYRVEGAVAGTYIGVLIPFFMSFFPLKFIFDKKITKNPTISPKLFISYGIPSMLISIGLSGFITNDLILVKHYFQPDTAGLYAGLAIMGKIIFFVSAPITSVMFPLIVQQHTKKDKFLNTFFMSFIFILLPSVGLTLFFTIFPEFSVLFILKKKVYLGVIQYLTLFSVMISIYSLVSVLTNFYLSIKKTIIAYPLIIIAVLQILLIIINHQNLQQIITISLSLNIILLIYLFIYFPIALKKHKATDVAPVIANP